MSGHTAHDHRALAEAAWSWVQEQVRGADGPWLPDRVEAGSGSTPPDDRDSLYGGIAGLAPVLAEVRRHRALTDAEERLAAAVADRLEDQARSRVEPSLYDGLAGDATALRLLRPGRETAAFDRLTSLATPAGWPSQAHDGQALTDVIGGSAGIVMTAVWAGGPRELVSTGADALLAVADETEAGLDWPMFRGHPSRMPNYAHGTAGVASALAVAGHELGRPDLVGAAVRGAQHLLALGTLDADGFVVESLFPRPSRPDAEPVTWTWCHGPTGTSYLFAALEHAGVEAVAGHPVEELRAACLRRVLTAGVPRRLRPGFWDNDGRCCGTAGVGEAMLDAAQATSDHERWLAAASTMADALHERAVRDGDTVYWRFVEHRVDPPLLPPGTSWMQGAAGIAAFLFRLARVLDDGPAAPVVDRPDQWWAVPAGVRTAQRLAGSDRT